MSGAMELCRIVLGGGGGGGGEKRETTVELELHSENRKKQCGLIVRIMSTVFWAVLLLMETSKKRTSAGEWTSSWSGEWFFALIPQFGQGISIHI